MNIKNIVCIYFVVFFSFLSFSQTVYFADYNGNSLNGDTIEVLVADTSIVTYKNSFYLYNAGVTTVTYRIKRYEESVLPGTSNYYCTWRYCLSDAYAGVYPFREGDASKSHTIHPSFPDTSGIIKASYKHRKVYGESLFRYVVYDTNNVNDSSYIFVKFNLPSHTVSLDKKQNYNEQVNVFPNPISNNRFTIDLQNNVTDDKDLKCYLVSSSGKIISITKEMMSTNKMVIHTKDIPQGTYTLLIKGTDRLLYKKLVFI